MSNNQDLNKELVSKAKELFKNKGYEIKTSHLYDVFAQLAGYKNWHTASAKNAQLAQTISQYIDKEIETPSIEGFLDYVRDSFLTLDNEEKQFVLFDPTLPAWNYSLSGETGSGKSIILMKLLYSFIKQSRRPIVCVFTEYGEDKAYKQFVQLNRGLLIQVGKDLPCINIFELDPEKSLPTDVKIKQLTERLLQEPNNKRNESELKIVLQEYFYQKISSSDKERLQSDLFPEYYRNSHFNFDNILYLKAGECVPSETKVYNQVEILKQMTNATQTTDKFWKDVILKTYQRVGAKEKRFPEMADLITVAVEEGLDSNLERELQKWTKTGQYPMFDQKTNINFSNNIIVVNFKGLESQKNIKAVYNLIIHDIISRKMHFIKDHSKLMVRDDLNFDDEINKTYLIEDLRTSRKNGLATITSTQMPFLSFIGKMYWDNRAILSSMQVHIFCKYLSSQVYEQIARDFNLKSADFKQLNQIGIKKEGQQYHNQFMVVKYNNVDFYKNVLSEKELDLYTSY